MPRAIDMEKTFYVPEPGEFVQPFIERHHRLAPWKRQSVAVLLFDPEKKYLALCLPHKVAVKPYHYMVRVPVQGRLTGRNISLVEDARGILWKKAAVLVPPEAIDYIGFGFTRSFRAAEQELKYQKMLHFVTVTLSHRGRLPPRTTYAAVLEWVHLDSVAGVADSSMDERKRWLFQEALRVLSRQHTAHAPRLRSTLR